MDQQVIEGLRLSPVQRRLWTLQQETDALPYRTQCAVRITGGLDVASLMTAIEQVVQRQEILRTTFRCLPGMTMPLQVINDSSPPLVNFYDLERRVEVQQEAQIANLLNELLHAPFDLEHGPLLLASLIKMSADRHVLLLCLPSLNADAMGLQNLVKEICLHYEALLNSEPLPAEQLQYADSSEWHNELLEAPDREEGRAYWREQDLSAIQLLELPYKNGRAENAKFEPQVVSMTIMADQLAEIDRWAEGVNTSAAMFLLACWKILLWRLTSGEQVIVGCATDGREYEELKTALGRFVKYLPVQSHLNQGLRFTELLKQLDRAIRESAEYQEYFNWEQPDLTSETHPAPPLFHFCFNFAEQPASCAAGRVTFTIDKEYACAERFHVRLSCVRFAAGLSVEFHYDSGLYSGADISRLAAEFQTLIGSVTAGSDRVTLSDLEIVGEAERQQLLEEWNDTAASYPRNECIHRLFEKQAAQTPDAVAVIYEEQQLTYAELDQRANQLAHHLRSRGVGAEVRVGLCVERSLEMIVGLLGILKAGGAYVPLDPTYPRERLRFMLADTAAPVLLTQQHLIDSLPSHQAQVVCLDTQRKEIAPASSDNLASGVMARNLAYIIYTSGSTGTPKGVLATHQNLVHCTAARSAYYRTHPRCFLLLSSFAFDSSVAGIFWTLWGGGTLVVPAEGLQRDVPALVRLVEKHAVTHLLGLPSLHALMLGLAHHGELATLQVVIVAGEVCPPELVERHSEMMAATRLYNEYGPTEASVWSAVEECKPVPAGRNVSIGRAIANTQIYILDERLRLAPIGVAGEMYLGGHGITRGYLHHAAMTAEKFIPNLFSKEPGARLYRTGDLGCYLTDGKIEFLGRIDSQVKIRGYRIELAEIETILRVHPALEKAVVVARVDGRGEQEIVAYVVRAKEMSATVADLRNHLLERVPGYMVPTWIVVLDELPTMANGKIDRQALPAPERVVSDGEHNPPRTPIEEVVAGIWSAVLGIVELSVTANFFELGGHSLLATQVMSRVNKAFNIELPVRILFGMPTVRGLAGQVELAIQTAQGAVTPPLMRITRTSQMPLSFAQQRLWFLQQLEPESAFYHCPAALRLSGPLDVAVLAQTLTEIIRRHEVLRTSFPEHQGRPVQVIAPAVKFTLPVTDLTGLGATKRESIARRLAEAEAERPFDLSSGPLLRASLLKLEAEEHIALFTTHHIVSDEWSMGVLIREVSALYEAYSRGEASPLAELAIQYADYAVWQREWLQGEVLEKQLNYWREQLRGAPEVLELPTDKVRPAIQSFVGASQSLTLSPKIADVLRALSRREGTTLFMTLLAAWQTLLYCHTGQEQIVVGTPIANRNRVETEDLIGFFANTLVLRGDQGGNPSFGELLQRVREVCLEAYAHQDVPFEKLVEELRPERSLSHSPLFQVWFALQSAAVPAALRMEHLRIREFEVDNLTSKSDLVLSVRDTEENLEVTLEYNSDLFLADTIGWILQSYEDLLASVASQPDIRLAELKEIFAGEHKRQQSEKDKILEVVDRQSLQSVRRRAVSEYTMAK
jgi:amino acid adenylation domain-containing protein